MTNPENEHLDNELVMQEHFQKVRDAATERFSRLSEEMPALAEFATEQGRGLAEVIYTTTFGADPLSDPAVPTLEAAYTRFVFAFTDPNNHEDTSVMGNF